MQLMFRIFTALIFLFSFLSSVAQVRYLDSMFSVTKHADIIYGNNLDNKNQSTDLYMDIYEPQNDTAVNRPLIVFIHGGSFVSNNRSDQGIDKTARHFAEKGYVTLNIGYRVEQTNVLTPFLNFGDPYNFYRAIARITQDIKAAVRYMKKDVDVNGNSFSVDTSTIFMYGSSAGAISAIHAAYLNDTSEMGFFFKAAYRDLGGLEGYSGNPGYSFSGVKAVVSCSGAIENLNYMNDNRDIAYCGFHNNIDLTVPFDIGCFVTVACHFGQFYGANRMYPKARGLGIRSEFYPINYLGHPVDQESEPDTKKFILEKTRDFLFSLLNNSVPTAVRNHSAEQLELFPNPTTGSFMVRLPSLQRSKNMQLDILSMTGQNVYSAAIAPVSNQIELNVKLPEGMYMLYLTDDTKVYLSKLQVVR
jgi:para-nitrobenzyl esterase